MNYRGWVVRMKEHMNQAAKKDEGIQKYLDKHQSEKEHNGFIAYGEFDRLQFIPIQQWNEYHREFLISDWIGQQQTVMLFHIGAEDMDGDGIDSYLLKDGENVDKGRFNVLTMLHLSNEIKDTDVEFNDILIKIKKAIAAFLDKYKLQNINDVLEYEIFGTFSSSEMAIIWSVSQYVDVINILDYLRYFHYQENDDIRYVFIASYTIVAQNEYYKGGYDDVRGDSFVRIEFSPDAMFPKKMEIESRDFSVRNNIRESLNMDAENSPCLIMSCIGKDDFIIPFPAAHLHQMKSERIPFGSKTVVLLQGTEDEEWTNIVRQNTGCLKLDIGCTKKDTEKNNSKLQEQYEIYQEILKKIQPYDICFEFRELFSLIFNDYKKVISSSVDRKWLLDYEEQFGAIIQIIKIDVEKVVVELENKGTVSLKMLLDRCTFMGNLLQQQVEHILESSKFSFTAPNSNMGYTAQFDLMMHMYYGIIKTLISNAYESRDNSWQYPLVPVVTFTNAPEVGSSMLYTADNLVESKRLIQFQVPSDAWAKPMFYLPYLVHEVYHYVTPYDRAHRNLSFLVIALTEMCTCYYMKVAEMAEAHTAAERKKYSNRLKLIVKYCLYRCISSNGEMLLIDVEKQVKERQRTFGYAEGCASDMPIYQMQEAFIKWCNYKGNSRDFQFCGWIQMAIKDISDNISNYALSREEANFLVDLNKGIERAKSTVEFPAMGIDYVGLIKCLFDYLREIYPDYAMIKHLGMGVSEYLVQIAVHQSNKLVTPSSAQLDFRQMCTIRTSSIIEYIRNGKELEDYREEFCNLYCSIIHTVQLSNQNASMVAEEKKDYQRQAEAWFDFFKNCYDEYREEYSVYGLELQNQIGNYREGMKAVEGIRRIYREYLNEIQNQNGQFDSNNTKIFDLCLELVLKMQKQTSISCMNQKIVLSEHKQRRAFKAIKMGMLKCDTNYAAQTTYVLKGGFGSVIDLLYRMVGIMEEYHNEIFGCPLGHEDLWYRGICNETFHILPSIYRKYAEETYHVKYEPSTKSVSISLQQLQHHLLQRFKYQADGAPEIMNQAIYQDNDYLALMQHYQLPSNLLDWSEDVFAALYFALEDYFKQKKNIEKVSPAIYIFDPAAYNRARKEMISEACKSCSKECDAYDRQEKLLSQERELVPNVSVQANRNIMADYFCCDYFDKDNDKCIHLKDADKILSDEQEICERCKLPVAYYCSRLSPRIRAQSGQFVAFNLTVHPYKKKVGGEKGRVDEILSFDYMSLDVIQNKYLSTNTRRRPFLLKMVIPQKECQELADLLRKVGIKTMKYYPELSNLKE